MTNVKFDRKGDILTITVNLAEQGTPSASGKSIVIASTQGNKKVDDKANIFVGVNVYKTK